MGKYLDSVGLSHFMGLMKPRLLPSGGSTGQVLAKTGNADNAVGWTTHQYAAAPSAGGNANVTNAILYGKVDSTSTSTVFTATVAGLEELVDGTTIMLHNGVVTSAANFTVNINGLGAKKCYNNMTNATQDTTIFNAAYTMMFVYASDLDGGNGGFWIYRGYDGNTNTIGYQLRTNSGNKTAADTGYKYRLWFTSADGSKWVPANTSTSTNATSNRSLNTRAIDPFGPIVYRSTNGTCTSGTGIGATGIWQQYTLTIGYSYMASGFSLAFPDSVYLKCTPNADGSATMNSIVQALPSSKDGKIYIYLGTAYSATNMELEIFHPVYWHDGTGIRAWVGKEIPAKTSDLTNDSGFITDAGVTSFNGSTGAITYTAPVTSVNGSTGAVTVSVPSASSTNPVMDGTAAVGSSSNYARADHVHPTDTSRQATLVSGTNIKTVGSQSLLGSGNLTPANIGAAASSHAHGNITNDGDITATAPTIASGDKLIINDESASKITNGPSFGTDTTKFLRNDGTWAVPSSGGSTVTVTQSLGSGTQVASISVDGTATALYAPTPPAATTTTPKMDGTAAVGSETAYAKGDHVHPSDTSRVPTTRKVNGKALSSDVTIYATDVKMSSSDSTTVDAALSAIGESVVSYVSGVVENIEADIDLINGSSYNGIVLDATSSSPDHVNVGYCSTAAGTAGKVVTLYGTSEFKLVNGAFVIVKFTATNTAAVANLTLSVESTNVTPHTATTAKPIKYRNANLPSAGVLAANRLYMFAYDGSYWQLVGDLDTGEANQNAFSNVKVGSTTIAADTTTDTIEIVAGSNVTLTPDATNDKLTIAASDTDTKNTAGAEYDSSNTLYLIGARTQAASPVTYSGSVRVADGDLFADSFNGVKIDTSSSAGFKLLDSLNNHGITVPTGQDYTLAAACAKGVDASVASGSTSTNLPTTQAVANYVDAQISALSIYSTASVIIQANAWSGTTATVNVTGVTASNDVIVAPAPASTSVWASAGIYCSAQGAGTLTFTCTTAPSGSVTANVMMFE